MVAGATASETPKEPRSEISDKERIVHKSIIAVFSVLISVSFVPSLAADDKKPEKDSVICDKKFDMISKKDGSKVGDYSIKAVVSKDKKRIEISETMIMKYRGKTVGLKSTVVCANKDGFTPIEGSVKTTLDKKTCMTGTVKFSPMGKTIDYACIGHLNKRTGIAFNPPKNYVKTAVPVALGTLVFQSAIPSIGPRILPAEGEMEDIVFFEFPDDIGAPELITVKTGYRLTRGAADKNGQYDIQLFGKNSKKSIASYRFDKNNQVVSMDLWGKVKLQKAAKTGKKNKATSRKGQ
jgi:hypothetical protein